MKIPARLHFPKLDVSRTLQYACVITVAIYLVIYVWIVYYRLQYPFELEWIEGGMADEVKRLVDGQGLYVAPSIHYVPFLYPPVFFYLSWLTSLVFGWGLFPLRVVSAVASLVSFVTIFLIVRKETANVWVAFLSTGLFAASFRVTGAWFDVARVDSLFLAFFLLSLYYLSSGRSIVHTLLAGCFAVLAVLTKQTALIIIFPVILFLFWKDWKHGLAFLGISLVLLGGISFAFERTSEGWFGFYVFRLLFQQTEWLPLEFIGFWKNDLLVHLPIAVVFLLFFILQTHRHEQGLLLRWMVFLAGALAGSFLTRVKIGGYDNVLLPAFAVIAILFGLGLHRLLILINLLPEPQKSRLAILAQTACLIQLLMLFYNPYAQIPAKTDLDAGNELVAYLSNIEGTVYLPDHGYLGSLAGKDTYAHHSAIWDVVRTSQQTEGKTILSASLADSIRRQMFDVIILDSDANYCCTDIDRYYHRIGEVFEDETAFFPVTGDKRRPKYIYEVNR